MKYKSYSGNKEVSKVDNLYAMYKDIINSAGSQASKMKICLLEAGLAAFFTGVALAFLYPIFLSIEFDNNTNLFIYIIVFTIFVIISFILRWVSLDYDYGGYASKASYELQNVIGKHLRSIPLEKLYSKRSGELSAVILENVSDSTIMSFFILSLIMAAIITPIGSALTLMFFDWRFGLVILLFFPGVIPLYLWRRRAFRRGFTYVVEQSSQVKGESVEFIQGLNILKFSGYTSEKVMEYQEQARKLSAMLEYGENKAKKPNLIITLTVQFSLLLTVCLSIVFIVNSTISAMVLAAILVIINQFNSLLNVVTQLGSAMEIVLIGYKRILNFLDIKKLPEKECRNMPTNFNIKFHDVSFSYENNEKEVLKKVNLVFKEKSMTALVGSSGCGKTTIARMIMRYADPKLGKVTIGDVDIKDMTQEQLMDLITVVFQEAYLLNDSIYNNIKMSSNATKEEVVNAAKIAQCHDFIIKLPNGYDTLISDIGSKLSGGEKQRIAIARALIKNSPIIILDEPTASLDTENEVAVQKAIDELVKHRTVIVIAHRLSTIVGANNIIVVDNGEIKESGTHEQLLANNSLYSDFWNTQQSLKDLNLKS